MEIGHRIRRARIEAGLNQRELAERIGVSHGLVGQWESHKKAPGRENVRKIAEATLTDAGELLGLGAGEGVLVRQSDELGLLRRYRRMSVRQRQNLLELVGIGADIAREMEQESEPAKG